MPINHTKVSAVADVGDTTLVRPVDWNAAHVIELAYNEFTSNVSVTATTSAAAQTCVASSSVAYDGATVVMIEFFATNGQPPSTSGVQLIFSLFEDSTDLGIIAVIRTPSAGTTSAPVSGKRRRTPSNASHTYTVKAWLSSGTGGTVSAGAGGTDTTLPGFIRITKV